MNDLPPSATESPDVLPEELPEQLRKLAAGRIADLQSHQDGKVSSDLMNSAGHDALQRVIGISDFAWQLIANRPALLQTLQDFDLHGEPPAANRLQAYLAAEPERPGDALRLWRQEMMLCVLWQDLNGLRTLEQSLATLSLCADLALQTANRIAAAELAPRYGAPLDENGYPLELVILAMGKLGGLELNFSSDIDLVFAYPAAGCTDGSRSLDNQQYFQRLGQRIISLLDESDELGRVYRVDMRLRPFGESGPLVVSFNALEAYLQEHGRDWERYAYVKARAVTGAALAEPLFNDVLRPFVYRRYLDYGVFEALREMRQRIDREMARRTMRDNIKLGPGGIREIEFVTQCLQLLRGGHRPALRRRSLLEALAVMREQSLIPVCACEELSTAYRYLRSLENRLQAIEDRQTHALPTDALTRQRLAAAMSAADWDAMLEDLDRQRERVKHWFVELVPDRPAGRVPAADSAFSGLWDGSLSAQHALSDLSAAGCEDPPAFVDALDAFARGSLYKRLDQPGRERLRALMPQIIALAAPMSNATEALTRVLNVLESCGRRSAYFAMLAENPSALKRLLDLSGRSEFLSRQIAASPLLLDELIDPVIQQQLPDRAQFETDLSDLIRAVPDGDIEQSQDALRRFQNAAVFRIALADIDERLPLMKVSDRLTDVAEIVVDHGLQLVWNHLRDRSDAPHETAAAATPGFAVMAYGKLAGLELGYGSDLDLVLVFDPEHGPGNASEAAVFYGRLGRRLINLLSMQTISGRLYEVDLRLRPSGESGLLVTSILAFDEYQRKQAWTWEHQALLRSRAIAGDPDLCEQLEKVRRNVLTSHVRRDTLNKDVTEMRNKMRLELSRSAEGEFDIKQDAGGIADIEFLVQYLVLQNAAEYPALLSYPDNMRQIDGLRDAGIIDADQAGQASQAYREYRKALHRLSLEHQPGIVSRQVFESQASQIRMLWEWFLTEGP